MATMAMPRGMASEGRASFWIAKSAGENHERLGAERRRSAAGKSFHQMLGMSAESHPRLVAKTTADRKVRMVDPAGCLGNHEAKNLSTTTMSGVSYQVGGRSP
jgi:hypothetical protein